MSELQVLLKRIHAIPEPKPKPMFQAREPSADTMFLLDRVRRRRWLDTVQDELMEAIIMLRNDVKFITHLPKCRYCQLTLQLDVERYYGSHSFWWIQLEGNEYLERRYRSCPKARDYAMPGYWEQEQYYRKHGSLDGMENTTIQFILARGKWVYKIYGKQIRTARRMLHIARNWSFITSQSQLEFDRLYTQLGMYEIAFPFEL